MAQLCQPCSCVPYENICCCPPVNGITVSQPECQELPGGSVVSNPCLDPGTKRSTWTYKFHTDCAQGTRGISSIAIPICETIKDSFVTVEEQIDGCGSFSPVQFSLKKTDPNFGTAPQGFQFLKVETSDRYDVGVSVVYRITINGDYPEAVQPVKVKAGPQVITFACEPEQCYIVPGCPAAGKLELVKTCTKIIQNNTMTLHYFFELANVGNAVINLVSGTERITYDAANITIGNITTNPPGLTVNTSVPGIIVVTGTIGPLAPGELKQVEITVPITSIASPGNYLIDAITSAIAAGTETTATCTLNVEAVQLNAAKCCSVTDGNKGTFRITVASVGNSPDTKVNIVDRITIPQGVTLQFQDFDGCTAKFADGSPVPLNTGITNAIINIECASLTVPKGGGVVKNIRFILTATTAFQAAAVITNTLQEVTFLNTATQLFLGVSPVPVSASINVSGTAQCQKPC